MNFRKILLKITWVLAGLMVVVMIGLMIYRHQLMKRVGSEPSVESQTAVSPGGDGAESGLPAVENIDREALKEQRIKLQRQMLADPSIGESIRAGLESQYKTFFEMLVLSPEQQEKLKELLTNSAMAYLELNPEIQAAGTDQEKARLQQRYDFLREETLLRVEALLGHDAYETYRAYEDRAYPRTVVSGFAESLPPGDRLTDDQQKELIEIMYGEAGKVYDQIGYDPTSRLTFPSDMDSKTVLKKMEITDRVLFNSADSSWGVLSESQLKAYNDYLRTYSEKAEMSLLMMGQQYE